MPGPRLKPFVEEVFREALSAVDPERSVRASLRLEGDILWVRGVPYRLLENSRLVLLAVGKAALGMAAGALARLGARVDRCVVVPKAEGIQSREFPGCRVIPGAHPIPDERSVEAGKALLKAVRGLTPDDLVLVLLSGGGSALAEVPRSPATLGDIVETTERLLRAGADIWLLNSVRRRLSALKGGRLAEAAAPARVVNLILSDVLGNPLSVIASGPTVPPEHIVTDLPRVLQHMGVWDELPERVRSLLVAPETTPQRFDNVLQSVVLADAAALVRAATEACRRRGLPAVTCGARFTGEAREFGRFWATLARSVREEHQPWIPPIAIVAGGELTVTVRGSGRGGRNTEMALAAAVALEGSERITVASLASDGDDGRSGAAGAVVDTVTTAVLRDRGIDPLRALHENDSATALAAADALVVTGLTGTNVNDLYLAIVE
ncbi:DUF4147 domain-containing protein [Thermomicrobium sp. 4228-Ro]|uniref:glycerate kinase type-2 family protein n=1 Tax=Thermomicrobium sp. 4228-Ro TaxID=2993937 RepID=UPI002249213A|nr:DUF4147 domain-containing protein [Thermomicrobium sp. 4228-Ro]MCX2727695.1 DUF4147 domain-containing protein [Thermomicrobium sp. 4228-Ro]